MACSSSSCGCARAVGLRIEDGEAAPEDILGPVALEVLRPRVPARDAPLGIEHEDRVIAHALDEQPERLLALAEPLRGLLPLGEIAGDHGEADGLALLAPDRGDGEVGPEAGSILADEPAFFLVRPFLGRQAEVALGLPVRLVFRQKEGGERLADDLRLLVALDPLGASVPARDASLGIEREDRVVAHCLHHEAKALLALLQRLPGPVLFGHVARHLLEAAQLALPAVQRRDHDGGEEQAPVLADTPAFLFVAPLGLRDLQIALRLARGHVVGRVEQREVPAEDLLGAVALDALGARVPALHTAAGVEHVDREIRFLEPEGGCGLIHACWCRRPLAPLLGKHVPFTCSVESGVRPFVRSTWSTCQHRGCISRVEPMGSIGSCRARTCVGGLDRGVSGEARPARALMTRRKLAGQRMHSRLDRGYGAAEPEARAPARHHASAGSPPRPARW